MSRKQATKETISNGEKIGAQLQKIRIQKGMSQVELAKKCNISNQAVSVIEKGYTPNPGIFTLLGFCKALNVSIDYLVFNKGIDNITIGQEFLVKFSQLSIKDQKRILKIMEDWINDL